MRLFSIRSRWPMLLVLLPGVLLSACEEEIVEQEPVIRPVKAIKAKNLSTITGEDIETSTPRRFFSGRAKATQEVELSFRVAGTLMEFPVNVGDSPERGDLVARLDPATFETAVSQTKAVVAGAAATLENARSQRERDETLYSKGHIAKARLDRTLARESEAAANLSAAKAELEKAELDLSYTALKAPFTGRVVATYVDNFQDVQAKEPILRLLDASQIEMIVQVPENMIATVPKVTGVVVGFDPFPDREFPARIKEIGTEASATTRTYPVTLILDQPEDITILPGMAGKAWRKVPVGGEEEGGQKIVVPVSATFSPSESAGSFVWIFDEASGKVARRQVELGRLLQDGVTVESGIEPGEWVVVAGVSYLEENQQVRLLQD